MYRTTIRYLTKWRKRVRSTEWHSRASLDPLGDGVALVFFHLSGQQGFEVAQMGLALPRCLIGKWNALVRHRRQMQGTALLFDGGLFRVRNGGLHVCTSEIPACPSSWP